MGTSVSVRGKTCTAHMFILKCLKAGCSKEQIRCPLGKQFDTTNFTQTGVAIRGGKAPQQLLLHNTG